jgi:Tfp pilus assembly protein PilN
VWLSSLDQNNATLTMSGIGTSLDAIADFETNLRATGYFRDINLVNANVQDTQGYFAFSMNCQFLPPQPGAPITPPPMGGN